MSENRHYQVVDSFNRRLIVKYKNEVIADSSNALILKEVGKSVYDPVYYFPKEDIKVTLESEAERHSVCPIKGDASYWNIPGNESETYFAWSYEDPLPRSKKIKGHIAFNMNEMTLISEPLV